MIPYGGFLVTLAVIFSATSALNATIYSATRASFALGRDGMLPPAFARIHSRRKTPFIALGVTAAIVLVASLLLDRHTGAAAASMMFLCLFFMVNLCAIRIRVRMGDELEYGFVMPLFPLFPILAIVCQVALAGGIFGESLPAFVVAGVWVPAGAIIYWSYSRTRAPAGEHDIQVLEEAPSPKKAGEYRMMVAVANPDNALQMVRTTYRLAQAKSANVQLLHMVPVPPQVPL
ncbi:MAG: APC family permease, partial [Planctomycetota bacterium]